MREKRIYKKVPNMKRKNKRWIRRLFGLQLVPLSVIITIGGFILNFLPISDSIRPLIFVDFILICLGLLYIYTMAYTPKVEYFERIDYGIPDEDTIHKAVRGILNTEKAAPFYVHVTPSFKEIETVYSRLTDNGFAMITGRPGEGKSMLAFQSAYRFQNESYYSVFMLKTGDLERKTGGEILDEILIQLDRLKGKKKIIIIDDAHKLAMMKDLFIILNEESKEGHGKYIWIETEFSGEEQVSIDPDKCIRINFEDFFESLLRNFYRSQNLIL
jgi:hypothetical protein